MANTAYGKNFFASVHGRRRGFRGWFSPLDFEIRHFPI